MQSDLLGTSNIEAPARVLSFLCEDIRLCPSNLDVVHAPTKIRAHSHIQNVLSDKDDPEVRIRLRELCTWEIHL